jgi:protein-S-isoprenylcysteine O-methyltransferase Ste14
MHPYIQQGLRLVWIFLILFWAISAKNNKQTVYKENLTLRFLYYWLPLILAALLLGPGKWFGHTLIREKFVEHTNLVGCMGLFIAAIGLVIACWSRYLLGKNWSLSVQKKENHELIQTGFYSVVRHPIYTGVLLIFTGNVIIVGDYRGFISLAIVFYSYWFKLKKEENVLIELFGKSYLDYQKKTKIILPYIL